LALGARIPICPLPDPGHCRWRIVSSVLAALISFAFVLLVRVPSGVTIRACVAYVDNTDRQSTIVFRHGQVSSELSNDYRNKLKHIFTKSPEKKKKYLVWNRLDDTYKSDRERVFETKVLFRNVRFPWWRSTVIFNF